MSRTLPLFFETGLYLAGRGASFSDGEVFDVSDKGTVDVLYLRVPAPVSWHFRVLGITVEPAAGICYGFGVRGKLKSGNSRAHVPATCALFASFAGFLLSSRVQTQTL